MALWGVTDAAGSKPKWLTASEKTSCLAADATETAASTRVNHQGWTVPAGGNDNANAMRETLVCVNVTTDDGTNDDTALGV